MPWCSTRWCVQARQESWSERGFVGQSIDAAAKRARSPPTRRLSQSVEDAANRALDTISATVVAPRVGMLCFTAKSYDLGAGSAGEVRRLDRRGGYGERNTHPNREVTT